MMFFLETMVSPSSNCRDTVFRRDIENIYSEIESCQFFNIGHRINQDGITV